MGVYDKVIYYCGLVAMTLSLGLIVVGATGVVTDKWVWIGKAIVGLVVGLSLFIRGNKAKQQAKAREAQELLNDVADQLNKTGKVT